jgi:hypothetical protein
MFQIQIGYLKPVLCLAVVLSGVSIHRYLNRIESESGENMSATTVTTNAGVQMPRLIYGTAWKKEATTQLVINAVLNGFRGIDTACQPKHYR